MGEGVGDIALFQEVDECIDIGAHGIDGEKVCLGDVPTQHVQRRAIFWKSRGHLYANEGVGVMRNFEGAGDRVVVRQRDEVHAEPLRLLVRILGARIRLGQQRVLQKPVARFCRGFRVKVQVDERHDRTPSAREWSRRIVWGVPDVAGPLG